MTTIASSCVSSQCDKAVRNVLRKLEHPQKEEPLQEEIQQYLENEFTDGEIKIQLDGNRIYIQVVSQAFEGMSRVKRQQRIYGCLREYIQSGELHAVSISALTQGELSS